MWLLEAIALPTEGFQTREGLEMAAGFIHTLFKFNRWTNEVEADTRNIGTFETKEDAVAAGRKIAINRKTEHVIHNLDGVVSERNSYSNDAAHRRG